jgi:membrane associated rhomboid family serine protease
MKDDPLLQPRFLLEVVLLAFILLDARLDFANLIDRLQILAVLVAIAWIVYLVNFLVLGGILNQLGVRPRTLTGLLGIPISAFLHSDARHLLGNTQGFLLLGGRLILLRGTDDFTLVSLFTLLTSGFGIWLFGRPPNHVGASGVLFGYFGFLLLRGYFERNAVSAILSILMIALYSTTLWRVLPSDNTGISWEGHLFGFLGGAIAARLLEPLKLLLILSSFRVQ